MKTVGQDFKDVLKEKGVAGVKLSLETLSKTEGFEKFREAFKNARSN